MAATTTGRARTGRGQVGDRRERCNDTRDDQERSCVPWPSMPKKLLTCACSCAILDTDQTSRDDLWSAAVVDLGRDSESALAANIEVSQNPRTVRV